MGHIGSGGAVISAQLGFVGTGLTLGSAQVGRVGARTQIVYLVLNVSVGVRLIPANGSSVIVYYRDEAFVDVPGMCVCPAG